MNHRISLFSLLNLCLGDKWSGQKHLSNVILEATERVNIPLCCQEQRRGPGEGDVIRGDRGCVIQFC